MSNLPATAKVVLYQGIRDVLLAARTQVRQTVNTTMVQAYWQIGRLIVEDEQGGNARAEYGKGVWSDLARRLTAEFGEGFSLSNLRNFRQFYFSFTEQEIRHTVCGELSWSHLRLLMRVEQSTVRTWYANEAVTHGWSVRALDRQISTLFYGRLLGSQDQAGARAEAVTLIARDVPADPRDLVGKLAHQDVGQMDMYVRVFEEQYRSEGDNPTLGLILCSERNAAVTKYSMLADNAQLFASKYQLLMPSEDELRAELERDRALLESARESADD